MSVGTCPFSPCQASRGHSINFMDSGIFHHRDTEARRKLDNLPKNSSFGQCWCEEIEDQAHPFTSEFQVGKELRFMNGKYVFNTLELKNDCILDKQVKPVTPIQIDALVCHWHGHLSRKLSPRRLNSWQRHSSYADSSRPGP